LRREPEQRERKSEGEERATNLQTALAKSAQHRGQNAACFLGAWVISLSLSLCFCDREFQWLRNKSNMEMIENVRQTPPDYFLLNTGFFTERTNTNK